MKRSRQIYMEDELWFAVDKIVAERQAKGDDISRSRWVEAAIRLALADGENLKVNPAPVTPWTRQKLKVPVAPVSERDDPPSGRVLADEPIAEIPIVTPPPAETKIVELMDRLEASVQEAQEARTRHPPARPAPAGEVAASPPAPPPGPPERPQRARVPSMAEHLALNPQLVANDLDSHMALNPDLAGTPVVLDVPPPTGTPVDEIADFSTEPTLPPAAIEKLKDETGPNPVIVHAATILYEKIDGKWCWTCPDAGITGVSRFVNDIRADAWEPLTNHYGHDHLTLEVRRKP